MVQLSFLSAFALLATLASAAPVEKRAWPAGNVTCGSNVYTLAQVKSATSAGYARINSPIGSSKLLRFSLPSHLSLTRMIDSYPHTFNNYEGLSMWCSSESDYNEVHTLLR